MKKSYPYPPDDPIDHPIYSPLGKGWRVRLEDGRFAIVEVNQGDPRPLMLRGLPAAGKQFESKSGGGKR